MIVAANQPTFAPYPGFFAKAALADVFVLLDTVQFPRGTTWITRNRFKGPSGGLRLTVPVWKKGLGLQRIRDVRICHDRPWGENLLRTLWNAYRNAPYFRELVYVWEEAVESRCERLLDLNLALIRHLLEVFGIETRLVLLSELDVEAAGDALLIEICQHLGAHTYLAQESAAAYLDGDRFRDAGLALRLFRPPSPVYPQLWGDFLGNLSAFDLVWNCGGAKGRELISLFLNADDGSPVPDY